MLFAKCRVPGSAKNHRRYAQTTPKNTIVLEGKSIRDRLHIQGLFSLQKYIKTSTHAGRNFCNGHQDLRSQTSDPYTATIYTMNNAGSFAPGGGPFFDYNAQDQYPLDFTPHPYAIQQETGSSRREYLSGAVYAVWLV